MSLQLSSEVFIPANDIWGDTKARIYLAFKVVPKYDSESHSYVINGRAWGVEPEQNSSGKVTYYDGGKIVASCIDDGNGRVMFSVH